MIRNIREFIQSCKTDSTSFANILQPFFVKRKKLEVVVVSKSPSVTSHFSFCKEKITFREYRYYIFGGYCFESGKTFGFLLTYNPETKKFDNLGKHKLLKQGFPKPRFEATMILRKNDKLGIKSLILFGGNVEGSGITADMFECDLVNYKWKTLNHYQKSRDGFPLGITSHGSLYLPKVDKMIVFGGWNEEYGLFNSIYLCDFLREKWTMISPIDIKLKPSPRNYMSINLWKDRYIILFGGHSTIEDVAYYYNDVWFYDLELNIWKVMQCKGEIPPKRDEHGSLINEDKLYISGGEKNYTNSTNYDDFYILDIPKQIWKKVDIIGLPPIKGHGMGIKFLKTTVKIFWLGGCICFNEKSKSIDKVYEMEIDIMILNVNRNSFIDLKIVTI